CKIALDECEMTTALIEILRQAEKLSADEQLELAAKLIERARKSSAVFAPRRRHEMIDLASGPPTGQIDQTVEDEQGEENIEGLDVFSLHYIPPEDAFVVQMRFVDAGQGEPARFDCGS